MVIAAVQSMHNRGYDVTEAEKFMEEGLKASEEKGRSRDPGGYREDLPRIK